MPDPLLPGKFGLYVSMVHYGLTHNTDFAREHVEFYQTLVDYLGSVHATRVLDVGCGKSFWLTLLLHSAGAVATGVDTEVVECGFSIKKYRRLIKTNGLERALRTFVWELLFARPYYRELARQAPVALDFDRIDLRQTDGARLPCEDDSYDLVVSHEVFEHIVDVEAMVQEIRRVIHPEGRTFIYVHNYTSLSGGHHIAWKYPDTEPSKVVPPWDHLRARKYSDIPSWVNGMREGEYRRIFSRYFDILDWFTIAMEGAAQLTPALRAQLCQYSREELLSKGFVIVARPKANNAVW